MSKRSNPVITPRKEPQQARSAVLVDAALQAAVQVLSAEGAARFTMARVAERAGVSVGSLYQYFPNKASILFRLQSDEWRQTATLLHGILKDIRLPPLERLRMLVHAFIRSECEEAAVRGALEDAAPLYRDAPEAKQRRAASERTWRGFMREALPKAPESTRKLAAHLIATTLRAVGRSFSARPRSALDIARYSAALADMFGSYLQLLAGGGALRCGASA